LSFYLFAVVISWLHNVFAVELVSCMACANCLLLFSNLYLFVWLYDEWLTLENWQGELPA